MKGNANDYITKDNSQGFIIAWRSWMNYNCNNGPLIPVSSRELWSITAEYRWPQYHPASAPAPILTDEEIEEGAWIDHPERLGIFARKLQAGSPLEMAHPLNPQISGLVLLWGDVHEYTEGYRAQYGRVLALDERNTADHYGVDLLNSSPKLTYSMADYLDKNLEQLKPLNQGDLARYVCASQESQAREQEMVGITPQPIYPRPPFYFRHGPSRGHPPLLTIALLPPIFKTDEDQT